MRSTCPPSGFKTELDVRFLLVAFLPNFIRVNASLKTDIILFLSLSGELRKIIV